MSIFTNIWNKIVSHATSAADTVTDAAKTVAAAVMPASASATEPTTVTPTLAAQVDVEYVLSDLAKQKAEKLNWKTSIVDLMKVLDMDSSLQSRKDLAKELAYTGDTTDSATMNMWLHKEVVKRFAENGGKVPADLVD